MPILRFIKKQGGIGELSRKKWMEIRFKIPKDVYDVLRAQIEIPVGEYIVKIDKINAFARECFYRGLAQILEKKSHSSEMSSGSRDAKSGDEPAEVSKKRMMEDEN